jgi:hypothetical protein
MPLRKSEIRETGEGQVEVVVEYEIRRVFHKRQGIPVMIFKDSDAIELLESAGYDKYKLTTDGVVASNSIRFPQVAVWKFAKVLDTPKKKRYNRSRKKKVTPSLTDLEESCENTSHSPSSSSGQSVLGDTN